MIIAVTESNDVFALNATTGTVIWVRNLGRPVISDLPCGNINPVGITGTPVVDLASRRLFFDALIVCIARNSRNHSTLVEHDRGAFFAG
jgi:outer membrane protein assembly factor BamB